MCKQIDSGHEKWVVGCKNLALFFFCTWVTFVYVLVSVPQRNSTNRKTGGVIHSESEGLRIRGARPEVR